MESIEFRLPEDDNGLSPISGLVGSVLIEASSSDTLLEDESVVSLSLGMLQLERRWSEVKLWCWSKVSSNSTSSICRFCFWHFFPNCCFFLCYINLHLRHWFAFKTLTFTSCYLLQLIIIIRVSLHNSSRERKAFFWVYYACVNIQNIAWLVSSPFCINSNVIYPLCFT